MTLKQALNKVAHLEDVKDNFEAKNKIWFENESIKWWNFWVCSVDSKPRHKDYSVALQFIANNLCH